LYQHQIVARDTIHRSPEPGGLHVTTATSTLPAAARPRELAGDTIARTAITPISDWP
jgi:hypothetical protein